MRKTFRHFSFKNFLKEFSLLGHGIIIYIVKIVFKINSFAEEKCGVSRDNKKSSCYSYLVPLHVTAEETNGMLNFLSR